MKIFFEQLKFSPWNKEIPNLYYYNLFPFVIFYGSIWNEANHSFISNFTINKWKLNL